MATIRCDLLLTVILSRLPDGVRQATIKALVEAQASDFDDKRIGTMLIEAAEQAAKLEVR